MKHADAARLLGLPATATEEQVLAALRQRVQASARPWGSGDPVDWAVRGERIAASSADWWRTRHREDPAGVERTLMQLHPVTGLHWLTAAAARIDDEDDELDREIAHLSPPGSPGRRNATGPSYVAASAYAPGVDASPPMAGYANAVEELRSTHPALVRAAERGGPAPTMFAGGDYPSSTASGIDPRALDSLPWRARLAASWEPTLAGAHRIAEQYTDDEIGAWEASQDLGRKPAVADYIAHVQQWAATSGLQG